AVLALEAVEEAHPIRRIVLDLPHVGPDLVVPLELTDREVLRVDVIPYRDVPRCEPDHLPVTTDLVALTTAAPRDLGPRPDVLPDVDMRSRVLENGACRDLALRNGHIVLGFEDDGEVGDGMDRHDGSSLLL